MTSLNPNSILYQIMEELITREKWLHEIPQPDIDITKIPGAVPLFKLEDPELQALHLISIRHKAHFVGRRIFGLEPTLELALSEAAASILSLEITLRYREKLPIGQHTMGIAAGWTFFKIEQEPPLMPGQKGMVN